MPSGSACSRRMLGVALGIGVLLALVGCTATEGCVAPQELVSQLLQRLGGSVSLEEAANPSVLLAMNLAGGDSEGPIHKWLLQEIKEEAVRRAQKDMTSGQVALHVLALLSSCQDPQRVHALEQTLDLIRVLQQKTDEEMAKLEADGIPKTSLYSVSLDTLALCLAEAGGAQGPSVALAKQVLSPESHLSVDTRAMVALALACVYDYVELHDVRDLLREALFTVSNGFLDEQEKRNGMIGNIYSMGLALQALEATRKFYAPRQWDCAQAFSVVSAHDYQQPTAIAQVLPALVGRSYLDVAGLDCAATKDTSPNRQLPLSPVLGTHGIPRAPIQVHYSITNTLQGKHFHYSTSVTVPSGSTLLRVMEVAAEENPEAFSFQTEQTSWGAYVTSIHGLAASTEDRTYWQFLSAGDALEEGVSTYKPHAGEHIQAVFSTY
ncbi:cobalamin binding intrinsic factor-like [Corvus moneduloides]|uniref:cobalamin binding intrinsic factor-like n=1 Tax=Corvus moneduloides TaxID=1196302 RepID=UPI001362DB42|nr:cobalamin binding intrinsic factor-like [Corvus moneduloides]